MPSTNRLLIQGETVHAEVAIAQGKKGAFRLEMSRSIAIGDGYPNISKYIEGIARMLEAPKPEDYIIATGHSHKLIEFVESAFELTGKNSREYVTADEHLIRPTDILKTRWIHRKQRAAWDGRPGTACEMWSA